MGVGVLAAVCVGEGMGVSTGGSGDGVFKAVAVRVTVGVADGSGVAVSVGGTGEGVRLAVGVRLGGIVDVAEGVRVDVGGTVGVREGRAVRLGADVASAATLVGGSGDGVRMVAPVRVAVRVGGTGVAVRVGVRVTV